MATIIISILLIIWIVISIRSIKKGKSCSGVCAQCSKGKSNCLDDYRKDRL